MFSMEGGVSVKRPLSGSALQLAADSVLRLRKVGVGNVSRDATVFPFRLSGEGK